MSIIIKLDADAIKEVLSSRGEEVKIELQNAIVQEFTNKYLKSLVNSSLIKNLERDMKIYTQQVIDNKIGIEGGYPKKVTLSSSMLQKIEQEVSGAINLSAEIDKLYKRIGERIDYYTRELEQHVDTVIKANIIKTVDKKVQEKLNAIVKAI